jgi:hypothetical protein
MHALSVGVMAKPVLVDRIAQPAAAAQHHEKRNPSVAAAIKTALTPYLASEYPSVVTAITISEFERSAACLFIKRSVMAIPQNQTIQWASAPRNTRGFAADGESSRPTRAGLGLP